MDGHTLGQRVQLIKFLKLVPPKIDVEINEIKSLVAETE
jgi:hypothetical protein